jgi:hypothetical protein
MHACLGTPSGTGCGGWLFSEEGGLSTFSLSCIALANCSSLTFGDGLSLVPGAAARHKKLLTDLSQDLPREMLHEIMEVHILTKSVVREEEICSTGSSRQ